MSPMRTATSETGMALLRLDVPTLLIVLAGLCLMLGGGLVVRRRRPANSAYVGVLGGALLLAAPTFAFAAFRGQIPDWLSIYVANGLLLTALGVCWNGFRIFNQRRPSGLAVIVPPLLWTLASLHPEFYSSFPLRVAAVWSAIALVALGLSYEVWIRGADRVPARRAVGLICLTASAISAGEVVYALQHRGDSSVEITDGWIALPVLLSIFALFGTTVLLLGMTQQRVVGILRRQASLDALTGLLNRGAFVAAASAQIEATARAGTEIGLLLFDLDRFKDINDSHGHAAGDAVLVAFANLLRQTLRETDAIGRIGGEEFAALLPGVDSRLGGLAAEAIRNDLARLPIEHAGIRIAATVSVGVAIAPAGDTDLTKLMARSDRALYTAKRNGRNRVVLAPA